MNLNFFQRQSLKSRVTLFALVIFLVGTWSLAWYASRMLHRDMERMVGEHQYSTVSFIAAEINQELDDRIKALQRSAEKITPAIMRKPAMLQTMLEDQPTFHLMFNNGVAAAGTDGTVIAEFPRLPGRLGANFMERDYAIGPLKEGRVTIGRPVMSKLMHAPAFVIGVPIFDAQGKVIGMLGGVVDLRLPNFLDKVSASQYGKTGGYLLVAPQYRLIVTASDKRRIMEVLPAPGVNPMIDRFIDGHEGSTTLVNPTGVGMLASARRIPVAGWYVAVALPTEEVFAPIDDMLTRVRWGAGVLSVIFAALMWWMLRRQLAPMLATVKTLSALSVASGAPQPLPVAGQDEIGDLIGGFNRLLEALRQREDALKESESRFRSLTAMSSDFYWESDAEHRLTTRTASKREAAEGVVHEASPIGKPRWEAPYLAPDEAGWRQHRAMLDAHLPFRDFEIARPRSNGSVHYVSVSGDPVFDAAGSFKGYRGVGADITDRTIAQQSLRASEKKFATAFRSSPMFVAISTAADGRYVDVNEAALRAMGYTREEVVGHTANEIGLWKDPDDRQRALDSLLKHGRISGFEADLRKKSGEIMVGEIWGEPIEIEGKPCVFWVTNDITARRNAEAEIRRINAELEQRVEERTHALQTANHELESFAYSVSHDLRAPLRAIEGFSRLIESEYAAQLDDRGKDYFRRIRGGATRMAVLIDNLLNLSKVSRQQIHPGPVDLTALARETAEDLQGTEPERRVEWVIAPDIKAHGDPSLLHAVMQNLIGNAWKYSSKRESARIEFGALEQGGNQAYFVRDNGVGFDMAYADKLFGAFQRLHSPGEFPGTGIGLATVKRIIQRHGGDTSAESKPGEGATFYFTL